MYVHNFVLRLDGESDMYSTRYTSHKTDEQYHNGRDLYLYDPFPKFPRTTVPNNFVSSLL